MTKQVNTFGSTLKKIGGLVAMAFGTAALVNFGKESIRLASGAAGSVGGAAGVCGQFQCL